jgi:hypothetical protein
VVVEVNQNEVTEQKPAFGETLDGIVKEKFNKSKGCSKWEQKDNAVLKGKNTNGRKWELERKENEGRQGKYLQ